MTGHALYPDKPLLETDPMPSSTMKAVQRTERGLPSLSLELTGVLLLKVVLLAGLWLLFFRHDPNAARLALDSTLFVRAVQTTGPPSTTTKEIQHDIRR